MKNSVESGINSAGEQIQNQTVNVTNYVQQHVATDIDWFTSIVTLVLVFVVIVGSHRSWLDRLIEFTFAVLAIWGGYLIYTKHMWG